jgi:hypothetical protein
LSSIPNQSAAAIFSAMGAGVRSPVTPDVIESQQAGANNLNQDANRALQAGMADQEAQISREGLQIKKQELDIERQVSAAQLKIQEASLKLQEMLGLKQLTQEKEIADRAQSQRKEEFTAEQAMEQQQMDRIAEFQNRTLRMDEFQMRRTAAVQDLQMQMEIGDQVGTAESRKRLLELDRTAAKTVVASNIASLAAREGNEAAAAALIALGVTNQKALEADGVVRNEVAQAANAAFRGADLSILINKMDRGLWEKTVSGATKSWDAVGDFFTGTELKPPKDNYIKGLRGSVSSLQGTGLISQTESLQLNRILDEVQAGWSDFANIDNGTQRTDVKALVSEMVNRNPQVASVLDAWADSILVAGADASDQKGVSEKALGREIVRVAEAVKDTVSVSSPADTQRIVDDLMNQFEMALPTANLSSMSDEEQKVAIRTVADQMAAYTKRLPPGVREDVDEAVTKYLEGKLGERKAEVDLRGYRRRMADLDNTRVQIESGDVDAGIQRMLQNQEMVQDFLDAFGADALEDAIDG